jgi:acyl-CoA synthetase (AMP-forming)/AMP-acid ligase II
LIEAWGPVLRLVYIGPGVGAIAAIEGVDVLLHPGSMGAPLADPAAPRLRIAAEDPTGAGLIEVEHPTGSGTWVSWGDRGWMSKGRLTVLDQFHAGADARGRAPQLVEAALVAHPSVADAAVVTRRGTSAMISRAYVQPAPGAELRGLDEVLIAALREQVPEPWVPAQIAIVPLVPRTATGKLDRRRLLAHEPGSDLG